MAKVKTFINAENENAYDTALVDEIETTYKQLTKTFGRRTVGFSGENKIAVQWHLLFKDGTIATIYNYKDGIAYAGKTYGLKLNEITNWHIGGFDQKASDLVKKELGLV